MLINTTGISTLFDTLHIQDVQLEMSPYDDAELTVKGRLIMTEPTSRPMGFRTGTSKMINKVIYNNPATIVYWKDGTKTVVKCDPEDTYDPMTGLALCYMKKFLGNNSRKFNDALHDAGF